MSKFGEFGQIIGIIKKCDKMKNDNMENTNDNMENTIKPNPKTKSLDSAEKKASKDFVAQEPKQNESEDKNSKDCRDHCMHCGNHCIYLKND